mmetsp:Transcript_30317/g.43363  ORF Transcript_30317/g.43363 Transcript_30317/m.43363 type:complete len:493 (+) Transcript_30317:601-2079(+)|eukprot:CAMPEP_0170061630 /NCGR_PEP_ID=MMETSP0019_2-20121128/3131_1 /TAXON_ID=98059 /ORGANISM="Dinobryon sp., Strain UTEXLB2267" /LENGTH=492 /DNA_ID=CAMNT_0010267519 /DNA_START=536 /DNA_END=2014 /DNA_ORIENTATION=-
MILILGLIMCFRRPPFARHVAPMFTNAYHISKSKIAYSHIIRLKCTHSESDSAIKSLNSKENALEPVSSSKSTKSSGNDQKTIPFVPFPINTELTLDIEDITNMGMGAARVLLPDGSLWVVFVPLVLYGEKVLAKIKSNKSTYSEATLVKVLEPSLERVNPQCKYFSVCGGCQYQHMSLLAQRHWKQQQVITSLNRIGGLKDVVVNPVVGTDESYGYRAKLTPHFDAFLGNKLPNIGFFHRQSKSTIVDIDECVIATANINQKYKEMKRDFIETAKKSEKSKQKGATFLFREVDDGVVVTDPNVVACQTVGNIKFHFKTAEFFQNNPFVLPLLVDHVVAMARGDGCKHLLDAFCGTGLFALCAADHFQSVYGVELVPTAVETAIRNAMVNQIENVEFTKGLSQQIFTCVLHLDNDCTAVVLDPPRKGCDEDFLRELFLFLPKKIVYVSCDPATQARDARQIVDAGYDIVDVTPFDMFPQTRHIENVITFFRK